MILIRFDKVTIIILSSKNLFELIEKILDHYEK